MKVGVKLTETGYTFGSDERLQVLLTNSLQPPRELDLEERMASLLKNRKTLLRARLLATKFPECAAT